MDQNNGQKRSNSGNAPSNLQGNHNLALRETFSSGVPPPQRAGSQRVSRDSLAPVYRNMNPEMVHALKGINRRLNNVRPNNFTGPVMQGIMGRTLRLSSPTRSGVSGRQYGMAKTKRRGKGQQRSTFGSRSTGKGMKMRQSRRSGQKRRRRKRTKNSRRLAGSGSRRQGSRVRVRRSVSKASRRSKSKQRVDRRSRMLGNSSVFRDALKELYKDMEMEDPAKAALSGRRVSGKPASPCRSVSCSNSNLNSRDSERIPLRPKINRNRGPMSPQSPHSFDYEGLNNRVNAGTYVSDINNNLIQGYQGPFQDQQNDGRGFRPGVSYPGHPNEFPPGPATGYPNNQWPNPQNQFPPQNQYPSSYQNQNRPSTSENYPDSSSFNPQPTEYQHPYPNTDADMDQARNPNGQPKGPFNY